MEIQDQFTDIDLSQMSVLPRAKRRRSNIWLLPMLLIGGLMGILAGYGALSLMGVKGFGKSEATTVATEPSETKQKPAPVIVQQSPQQIKRLDVQSPTSEISTPDVPAVDREESPKTAITESTPAEKPRLNQKIRLNLDKPKQREATTLKGNLRVVEVGVSGYKLNPKTGTLPAAVTLEGPRPVILNVAMDKGMLTIEPTVTNDDGKTIPFTTKRLSMILRRAKQTGMNAENNLESLKVERTRLKANLDAHVPMAYLDHKAAVARVRQLNELIPQAEKSVVPLEADATGTQALADFAHQLNGKCSIVIEASSED